MDPPPVHIQIQPQHARHQQKAKAKGKGSFAKVSGSNTRKTNNYRIRSLADGRLGQQHALRTVQAVNTPEEVGPDHPDNPQPPSPGAGPPPPPKKKQRVKKPNTWAVSLHLGLILCLLLTYACVYTRLVLNSSCLSAIYILTRFCVTTASVTQLATVCARSASLPRPLIAAPLVSIPLSYVALVSSKHIGHYLCTGLM